MKSSRRRLPAGEASFNDLFRKYRVRADRKGIEFSLTPERFRTLTKRKCYICGRRPSMKHLGGRKVNGHYLFNGVDRLNNSEGYTLKNSVACCRPCNFAKGQRSLEELLQWLYDAFNYSLKPYLKKSKPKDKK